MRWACGLAVVLLLGSLAAAAEPPAKEAAWYDVTDPLPEGLRFRYSGIFEFKTLTNEVVFCDRPSPFFAFTASNRTNGVDFALCDLRKGGAVVGKAENLPRFQGQAVLSPFGTYVAGVTREGILIWPFGAGRAKLRESKETWRASVIGFVDANTVAVVETLPEDKAPVLRLVDCQTGDPVRAIPLPDELQRVRWQLSPGGRFAAGVADGKIVLLSLLDNRPVQTRSLAVGSGQGQVSTFLDQTALRFSPDGSMLLVTHFPRVWVWDLRTGQLAVHASLSVRIGPDAMIDWFPDARTLLAGDFLIDVESMRPIYKLPENRRSWRRIPMRVLDEDQLLVPVERGKQFRAEMFIRAGQLPTKEIEEWRLRVRQGEDIADRYAPAMTPTDSDQARPIGVQAPAEPIPPCAPEAATPPPPAPASLMVGTSIFNLGYRSMLAGTTDAPLFLVFTGSDRDGQILRFDARTGRKLDPLPLKQEARPIDFDAASERVLLRTDRWGGSRLDVYAMSKPSRFVAAFRPYWLKPGTADRPDFDPQFRIAWAKFVDADLVLTLSAAGRLVLWKLPECEVLWRIDLPRNFPHAGLIKSQGQVVVPVGGSLVLLDARSGKPLGSIQEAGPFGDDETDAFARGLSRVPGRVEASPDGRFIVWTKMERGQRVLWAHDRATGQSQRVGPDFDGAWSWLGNTRAVVGLSGLLGEGSSYSWQDPDDPLWDLTLVMLDFEQRAPLLRLEPPPPAAEGDLPRRLFLLGDTVYCSNVDPEYEEVVRFLPLPIPPATVKPPDFSDGDTLAVKPGTKVRVQVDFGGEDGRKLTEEMTAKLHRVGLVVDPAADVTFRIRIRRGGLVETGQYKGDESTVSAQSGAAVAEYIVNGTAVWTVWKRFGGFLPPQIYVRQGETVADALARHDLTLALSAIRSLEPVPYAYRFERVPLVPLIPPKGVSAAAPPTPAERIKAIPPRKSTEEVAELKALRGITDELEEIRSLGAKLEEAVEKRSMSAQEYNKALARMSALARMLQGAINNKDVQPTIVESLKTLQEATLTAAEHYRTAGRIVQQKGKTIQDARADLAAAKMQWHERMRPELDFLKGWIEELTARRGDVK